MGIILFSDGFLVYLLAHLLNEELLFGWGAEFTDPFCNSILCF